METEYRCERCHRVMATGIFDRRWVCDRCRTHVERALIRELVRHG